MKKSVKILIAVLCLIIVGLVTFIVVDKVINKKVEAPKTDESKISNLSDNNNNAENNTTVFEDTDFYGDWNNDENTQLTINNDGTFQADHYTASSEIFGDYTINGETIEFICKKNDDTYNKKWNGKISKDSNGNYRLKVNLYDWDITLNKVNKNEQSDKRQDENKAVSNPEEIRIVSDYNHVSSTSGYMKVTGFDSNSNVVWTYKTDTVDSVEYICKLDWFHTNRAYIIQGEMITVLNALDGLIIGNCKIPKTVENDYIDIMATSANTQKGFYYVLTRHFYDVNGKDILYKIDDSGNIVAKSDIHSGFELETVYETFAQGVEVSGISVDNTEKTLECTLNSDDGGTETRKFDIEFK